jgi:ABC-type transporter Mla maintaining outer membrane lipid asymmetry permease subunit MlaE
MERRTSILVCVVLFIGMAGGYTLGTIKPIGKHIKTEYFLELKQNSVIIEDVRGNIISCSYDKLVETLEKDNL